jgi:hypothetical protein
MNYSTFVISPTSAKNRFKRSCKATKHILNVITANFLWHEAVWKGSSALELGLYKLLPERLLPRLRR